MKTILTPRAAKKQADDKLRLRLDKIRPLMPTNWIVLFIFSHQEYKEQSRFLSNVLAGKSMHLATIELIEAFAKQFKKSK